MLFLTQELSGKTIKQTNVFPIDRRSVLQRHLFSCYFPPLRVAGEDQSGFEVTGLLEECGGPTGECICQNFARVSLGFEDKSELKAQLPGKQVSFSQEAGIRSLHSSLATTLRECMVSQSWGSFGRCGRCGSDKSAAGYSRWTC